MKLLFIVFFPFALIAQDPWKNVYTESAWTERDTWQRPQEIIKQLNIKEGSQVADVGCHEGYMTVKLAKTVGLKGRVFAVDVDQTKLNKLEDHLKERKFSQVTLVKGDYDNPKLADNSLDAVIILDTYHEMDDHDKILQHIKASLKLGGRLVLCEPLAEERKGKSRKDQETRHELGMNYALEDLTKAGFHILFKKENFADRTKIKGDRMWIITALKK
ncbi:MAG TPA: methyltransferase domain-containing protein [Cyclobacteriaceae bacterium]